MYQARWSGESLPKLLVDFKCVEALVYCAENVSNTSSVMPRSKRNVSRQPLFWLAICVLISFAALAYPIYVIRPFRHQGARELAVALAVIQFTPLLEIFLVAAALILGLLCWRGTGKLSGKVAAGLGVLLLLALAGLSRVNIYELMFHPIDVPRFSPASEAKLDRNEEVIAIRIGGVGRAYPVRSMSYHHIVNDVVNGVPIVATY